MYLISRYAGHGRNLWLHLNDGTVTVRKKGENVVLKVRGGCVLAKTTRTKDERTILKYGHGLRTSRRNRVIMEEYFEPGSLRAMRKGGLWKKQTAVSLCGSKGTVECYSTSSGAYGKEVFTYNNGLCAYVATRWRKRFEVKRPNGRPWVVIAGQVCLTWSSIAERLGSDETDFGMWNMVRGQNWDLTVYDADGVTALTHGHVENRQKQGKWLEAGKTVYYMSGVRVSRELFEEQPDKWNAREILSVPNAQLRCSLLNRMGYDRLLAKVEHRTIDQAADGAQLLEITAGTDGRSALGPDRMLRLLKVVCPSTRQVYVLRVPPDMKRCEQARQWTFGLRMASIREGVRFDLLEET